MDLNGNNSPQQIRWTTFAVLFGLAVLLLVLDNTGNLNSGLFAFLRNPIAAVMDWMADRTDAYADVLAGPRDLRAAQAEIEQLRGEIERLERDNEELREVQAQYFILADMVDYATDTPTLTRIAATVISRDTSPAFRSITIDRGTQDGIIVGMPVESSRGLVGVVYRADRRSALVLLITDNLSSVAARLGDSRATGIVEGGGLGGTMLMDWISLEAQVNIGDLVLTSGLGGRFPPGISVGRVIEVERQEAELFQRAIVQPAVDVEALELVFVITNFEPIDTSVYDDLPGQ